MKNDARCSKGMLYLKCENPSWNFLLICLGPLKTFQGIIRLVFSVSSLAFDLSAEHLLRLTEKTLE